MTGEELQKLREQYGWSQKDLAKMIGCKQQRISEWETGKHMPATKYRRKLREILL